MGAERFIVTDKETGKKLWDGMAMSENEAKDCAQLSGLKTPREQMKAEVGEFKMPGTVIDLHPDMKVPGPRKERKDRGQTHKASGRDTSGQTQPAKKVRNRGQFFVFDPSATEPHIEVCTTRESLANYLDTVNQGAITRVIQGHELKFERRVQFSLKPIK